ncbi:glucans biosynthesis glucosyltransferase H [Marinobacterium zhoushanense]|uniref:Glucans biosynthesis glucosyltransferase H n=1 Tax=Marinobacterium zhoushanense TaxID=1679163 RepID=A0ABQ1KC03_9GAMM|nr:glucans biosynthesis glucosyltransferase MdoH [Marinobacterium zhoushanense]GGB94304.1 glucans biosynthesis glucosyltransferase H [Marinobacterium zhoushanense]
MTTRHEPGMPMLRPASMPAQNLRQRPDAQAIVTPRTSKQHLRRWTLLGAAAALLGLGSYEMYSVLALGGTTPLEYAMLGLFISTFGWIALAAVSALFGFVRQCRQLRNPLRHELFRPRGRTAVLLPCYNEDPAHLAAAVEAMVQELVNCGAADWFDWVLLSDTRDPRRALEEEQAVTLLRQRLGQKTRIYYRRRRYNIDRKAGNVAEFCRHWGSHYDYLVVLDADSLMSAFTLTELVYRMEQDPGAGLIQTIPRLINGTSLIARLQQFANRVYGPIVGSGLACWTNPEGNFWGHNAIIRRAAFMNAAGLPRLKGKAPFGGTIMSHDFVEAALLRRAGWKVVIADDLPGSYEECPPSILDLAIRDRRWCQGNLQHIKVIGSRGLHWISRMHLLTGIMSYLSSPLWLALILVGITLALQAQYIRPEYFGVDFSLFPTWPRQDAPRAVRLFILTMLILFVPKILGSLLFLLSNRLRRSAGGLFRLSGSIVTEVLVSAAIAPIMMCIHCGAVASILLGRDSGWNPQRRQDGSLPWLQLIYRHRWHTLAGILLALIAWSNSLALLAWLSPAIFGLVLAVPLSALTGSLGIGAWFKRVGILRTPEETQAPSVVALKDDLLPWYEEQIAVTPTVEQLLDSPELVARHLALTPDPALEEDSERFQANAALARVKLLDAGSRQQALVWLSSTELSLVLATPFLFQQLVALPCRKLSAA